MKRYWAFFDLRRKQKFHIPSAEVAYHHPRMIKKPLIFITLTQFLGPLRCHHSSSRPMSWGWGKSCTMIWSEDKYVLLLPLKDSATPEFICCFSHSLLTIVCVDREKGLSLQWEALDWEIFVYSAAEYFCGSKALLGRAAIVCAQQLIPWGSLNHEPSNLLTCSLRK